MQSGLDLDDLGIRCVLHDGSHALLKSRLGGIGLALADDLRISCLQDEVVFAVLGFLDFEAILCCVLDDGGDAFLRVGKCLILLAGEDDLAVSSLQIEHKLAICARLDLELSCHGFLLRVD